MKFIVATKNSNLNVRSRPEPAAPVVAKLARGTTVDVLRTESGWRLLARGGWASAAYLQPVSSPVSPVGPPAPVYAPLPNLEAMWKSYLRGTADEVKRTVGGAVDAAWIKNTCTIRICHAFNNHGSAIPGNFVGLSTVKGADGMNYAYRVVEMANYLEKRFGPPTLRIAGGTKAKEELAGRRGIIRYDVAGWSDATGHMDMWNGRVAAYAEYFGAAREVTLWS